MSKSSIYIFSFLFFFLIGCSFSKAQILIEIKPFEAHTYDTVKITVTIKNLSTKPYKVFKPIKDSPLYLNMESWTLHFECDDSIKMKFPSSYYRHYAVNKKRLFTLNPYDSINFSTLVNLTELERIVNTEEDYVNRNWEDNTTYGLYEIYLTYRNPLKRKKVQYQSNTINIKFIPH